MSFVKCPECGKEISDQTTNCPNCGYPIDLCDNKQDLSSQINESTTSSIPKDNAKLTDDNKPKTKKLLICIAIIVLFILVVLFVKKGNAGIVGKWRMTSQDGSWYVEETFGVDGSYSFYVDLGTYGAQELHGRYETENGQLYTTIDGEVTGPLEYTIDGNKLTISGNTYIKQ